MYSWDGPPRSLYNILAPEKHPHVPLPSLYFPKVTTSLTPVSLCLVWQRQDWFLVVSIPHTHAPPYEYLVDPAPFIKKIFSFSPLNFSVAFIVNQVTMFICFFFWTFCVIPCGSLCQYYRVVITIAIY